MTNKRMLTLLGLFVGGYMGVAAAGHDPTTLVFDWVALIAALSAAGLAQPSLSTASTPTLIVTTVGAFLVGYGYIMDSTGFRYVLLHFDTRAILSGLATAGIVHTNNDQVREIIGVQPHALDTAQPVTPQTVLKP